MFFYNFLVSCVARNLAPLQFSYFYLYFPLPSRSYSLVLFSFSSLFLLFVLLQISHFCSLSLPSMDVQVILFTHYFPSVFSFLFYLFFFYSRLPPSTAFSCFSSLSLFQALISKYVFLSLLFVSPLCLLFICPHLPRPSNDFQVLVSLSSQLVLPQTNFLSPLLLFYFFFIFL